MQLSGGVLCEENWSTFLPFGFEGDYSYYGTVKQMEKQWAGDLVSLRLSYHKCCF